MALAPSLARSSFLKLASARVRASFDRVVANVFSSSAGWHSCVFRGAPNQFDISIGRPPRSIPALYMFILDNLNSGDGQLALATLTNAAHLRLIDHDVVHCCR